VQRSCAVCGKPFDYEPRPGRPPVTCSPECQRTRKTRKSEESRSRVAAKECPPDKHGTSTGYTQYKCGCTKCTRWARLYKQERRAITKGTPQQN
jgi:hypothetical protein